MPQNWEILIDHQEQGRKAGLVEGRARGAGTPADAEEVPFSLTLYSDQVSLNVPANSRAREFIADLIAILGHPKLEPTVKCSCDWGKGVTGAMLIVLWDLPPQAAKALLHDLHAFLGSRPTLEKG